MSSARDCAVEAVDGCTASTPGAQFVSLGTSRKKANKAAKTRTLGQQSGAVQGGTKPTCLIVPESMGQLEGGV